MGKLYIGRRRADGTAFVRVTGEQTGVERILDPRLDLFNHSPTGFEWGYGGSGPAQLALALLADALHSDKTAIRLHQPFKFHVIGNLSRDAHWRLTEEDVLRKASAISEYPLTRMPTGEILRCCVDCTAYLSEHGMLVIDTCGIYNYAPGITLEDARRAVAGKHDAESGEHKAAPGA